MIHESLIKRLRTESLYKEKATIEIMDLCMAEDTVSGQAFYIAAPELLMIGE